MGRVSRAAVTRARILRRMTVKVNGNDREIADGTTLRQLVEEFKLKPERVAIEWNRQLVRAEKYDARLNAGDEIEIVTFVGGG